MRDTALLLDNDHESPAAGRAPIRLARMAAVSGGGTTRAAVLAALAAALLAVSNAAVDGATVGSEHAIWNEILQTYVDDDGLVAYRRLAAEARSPRQAYLAQLADTDPSTRPAKEQMAFWINAYNAGDVTGILQGQSPESVVSRMRFFRWYTVRIAGRDRTLDEIENEILRKRFCDPRIHTALVCGATGCPRLRREAYQGDRLDAQLDDQVRSFVNDPRRNVVDPATETVALSSIFKWFAADFGGEPGVRVFVARYIGSPDQAALLRRNDIPIGYLDYDWTLNAQPGQRPQ